MEKEQFLHDCLVMLPEIYEFCKTQGQDILNKELRKFAESHGMNLATAYEIGSGDYPLSLVYDMLRDFPDCDCRELKLPDGMKKIPRVAFTGCDITSVVLPASVEIIEDNAFSDCYSLQQVQILRQSYLKHCGTAIFAGCEKLSEVTMSEDLQLGKHAFDGTKYLGRLIKGEIPCPTNVFLSIDDSDTKGYATRLCICTSPVNTESEVFEAHLKKAFGESPDDVVRTLTYVGDADKMKRFMDVCANRKNIGSIMDVIINTTEKTGNIELRLEMMSYQHQIIPKSNKLYDLEL